MPGYPVATLSNRMPDLVGEARAANNRRVKEEAEERAGVWCGIGRWLRDNPLLGLAGLGAIWWARTRKGR
jgi:hypothetical protein